MSTCGYTFGMMFGMPPGEVFSNAPLALVAAEVRFPPVSEASLAMSTYRRIKEALGSGWVIHNAATQTIEASLDAARPRTAIRSEKYSRITSRERTRIVTVKPDNLIVEVVDYVGFPDFRELLMLTSRAVQNVLSPDGIVRVGLRYINEVSVPEKSPKWEDWLDSSLMASEPPPELTLTGWSGEAHYELATERFMVLRHGPSIGPVVSPQGPLRRAGIPRGPVFVLDFDSFWQPHCIPEFTKQIIGEVATDLHRPLRGLFDKLCKPRLIEVFRKGQVR